MATPWPAESYGQVCFEAYAERIGNGSLAPGQSLPPWSMLPAPVREAWDFAAQAARDAGEVIDACPDWHQQRQP